MIVFPSEGDRNVAEIVLNKSTSPDLLIKLFTNEKTSIDKTDTVASFTELTGCGYQAKTLVHGNWIISTEDGKTTSEYAEQLWTLTQPVQQIFVRGYFIVLSSDPTKIFYADKLPYPVPIQYAGDKVAIKPVIEWN